MSALAVEQLPDVGKWELLQIQLIAFPIESQFSVRRDWWRELCGNDPSATSRNALQLIEQGEYLGQILTVAIDLPRVSWSLNPKINPEVELHPIQTIGPFPDVRDQFVELMKRWVADKCPAIKRIGLAGKMVQRIVDHDAGYTLLGRYLKTVQVSLDSSEFLYRINRHRQSVSISTLMLNRLATWAFAKFFMQMRAGNPGDLSHGISTENSAEGCLLEFDINTPQDNQKELPRDKLPALISEFADLATEIAARGDVP